MSLHGLYVKRPACRMRVGKSWKRLIPGRWYGMEHPQNPQIVANEFVLWREYTERCAAEAKKAEEIWRLESEAFNRAESRKQVIVLPARQFQALKRCIKRWLDVRTADLIGM